MTDERPLVLVTGASGFIATHVIQQLLDTGKYRVRGTVRSAAKAQIIGDAFPSHLDLVETDLTRRDGWIE
jgi:nucleoside-diphosphate-sugar epimerase